MNEYKEEPMSLYRIQNDHARALRGLFKNKRALTPFKDLTTWVFLTWHKLRYKNLVLTLSWLLTCVYPILAHDARLGFKQAMNLECFHDLFNDASLCLDYLMCLITLLLWSRLTPALLNPLIVVVVSQWVGPRLLPWVLMRVTRGSWLIWLFIMGPWIFYEGQQGCWLECCLDHLDESLNMVQDDQQMQVDDQGSIAIKSTRGDVKRFN